MFTRALRSTRLARISWHQPHPFLSSVVRGVVIGPDKTSRPLPPEDPAPEDPAPDAEDKGDGRQERRQRVQKGIQAQRDAMQKNWETSPAAVDYGDAVKFTDLDAETRQKEVDRVIQYYKDQERMREQEQTHPWDTETKLWMGCAVLAVYGLALTGVIKMNIFDNRKQKEKRDEKLIATQTENLEHLLARGQVMKYLLNNQDKKVSEVTGAIKGFLFNNELRRKAMQEEMERFRAQDANKSTKSDVVIA